jgi:dolichol-phosphate mannosyltransferase
MSITSHIETDPAVAVVIPCFRETGHILGVIDGIGDEVRHIFVVDDACPDGTGEYVRDHSTDPRITVVTHERNTGVGGATLTGYRRAIEAGTDIIVKVDGDGQMDPTLIPMLIEPLARGEADYAKGNRFHQLEDLGRMPGVRIAGNLALSFASKLSSGYWNIFDPTNGFTAIHAKVARHLPFAKISGGYFFESDMLFRLNLMRAVVVDVPMKARYGNETSTLRIRHALFDFTVKHGRNMAKRILYSYFAHDFNIASIELVLGKVFFLFGIIFGAIEWRESVVTGIPATAGTVILAALPIILGSQLLLAFLNFDTRNIPNTPLHPRL